MSKTILVPTDFSPNALKAAKYALTMCERMDCTVHLLHAYAAFHSAFQGELANQTDEQRAELGAYKGMRSFLEMLGVDGNDARISTSVVKADLVDAVERYVSQHDIPLIVMGTHGASGLKMGLLGSNTYDVTKIVNVPVLVMPLNAVDVEPENAVFFTDYQEADTETLLGLVSLFGHLIKKCTLVHIHEGDTAPNTADREKLEAWKAQLKISSGFSRLDSELIHAKESIAVVDEILDRYNATLTVLTLIGGRSFFEKLTQKSLAKAIIHQPKTPVLLLGDRRD